MTHLSAVAILVVAIAAPAGAKPPGASAPTLSFDVAKISLEPARRAQNPAITSRSFELRESQVTTSRRRGLSIAQDIAPNATVSLGLLDMKPRKSRLYPDPQLDSSSRRSRKAAVRVTLKF